MNTFACWRLVCIKINCYPISQYRVFILLQQKDLTARELENRNTNVLHHLAEMADTVPGMSLAITKLLYEKGLEIPANNQHNVTASLSRGKSRASMMSSGRASECSLTINSREDDGILSRRLYPTEFEFIFLITPHFHMPNVFSNIFLTVSERTFASSTSSASRTSTTKSKKSEKVITPPSSSFNFQIEGQALCSERTSK